MIKISKKFATGGRLVVKPGTKVPTIPVNMIKDLARTKVAREIDKVMPGMGGHVVNVGEQIVHTLLTGDKDRPMQGPKTKPGGSATMFGASIKSMAVGSMTRSKYLSSTGRLSPSVSKVLSLAQKLKFNCTGGYQLHTEANVQETTCNTNYTNTIASPIYIQAIWSGNYDGQDGAFAALTEMSTNSAEISYNTIQTSKLVCTSADCETIISNNTKLGKPAIIDLYECMAIRDATFLQELEDSETPGNTLGPNTYWRIGLETSGTPQTYVGNAVTTAAIARTQLGSKPWQSQLFNSYWKIMAHEEIFLSPGASHSHVSKYSINRVMPATIWQNSSLISGVTRSIMMVIRGVPASSDTGLVGTDSAAVNVFGTVNYNAMIVPYSGTITEYAQATAQPTDDSVMQGLDYGMKKTIGGEVPPPP